MLTVPEARLREASRVAWKTDRCLQLGQALLGGWAAAQVAGVQLSLGLSVACLHPRCTGFSLDALPALPWEPCEFRERWRTPGYFTSTSLLSAGLCAWHNGGADQDSGRLCPSDAQQLPGSRRPIIAAHQSVCGRRGLARGNPVSG